MRDRGSITRPIGRDLSEASPVKKLVKGWLARIGLSESDLECGAHAPKLQANIEAMARANVLPGPAYNNCSGKHSGFLSTAVVYG